MTLDAVCFGEALVDLLPDRRGRLRDCEAFQAHSGGAPANVAVGLARLGLRAGFVGVVGEDEFGHLLARKLAEERVEAALRFTAEAKTGVGHHVALSIVGSERLPASGYLRAKVAQEKLIKASPIPYTIVRATQFFEFVGRIADEATIGQTVHLPSVLFQPIFSDDLAANLAKIAVAKPLNGTIELAGPDALPFDELARQYLTAHHDPRTVVTDEQARYFGTTLETSSLIPGENALLGSCHFADWLSRTAPQR